MGHVASCRPSPARLPGHPPLPQGGTFYQVPECLLENAPGKGPHLCLITGNASLDLASACQPWAPSVHRCTHGDPQGPLPDSPRKSSSEQGLSQQFCHHGLRLPRTQTWYPLDFPSPARLGTKMTSLWVFCVVPMPMAWGGKEASVPQRGDGETPAVALGPSS